MIRPRYHWPGMRNDITDTVRKCKECAFARTRQKQVETGEYIPIEAKETFEMICMDIVAPLPVTSEDNRYLLTIIDRFTRFVMAIPVISAVQIARTFINKWVYLFGTPKSALTDNGTQFTSEILTAADQIMGIKQLFTTIYHAEGNGMIERFHTKIGSFWSG